MDFETVVTYVSASGRRLPLIAARGLQAALPVVREALNQHLRLALSCEDPLESEYIVGVMERAQRITEEAAELAKKQDTTRLSGGAI
nr:hypothetical protein [Chloroflexota bacterium]